MKMIFETRFSFYGKSGWRSKASTDHNQLFEDARLKIRFDYFEHITLPSLQGQTDQDFQQIVLSSRMMPQKWQKKLQELCYDVLGEQRCIVHFKPWGRAGRVFRRIIRGLTDADNVENVAQVVLDDDDAVSHDFVEYCRQESLNAARNFTSPEDYTYISFPRGYSMQIGGGELRFVERKVEYNNQGLTLVAPGTTQQNPFNISHKKVGERRPSRVINDRKHCYIRTVHQDNDSRAIHGQTDEIPLESVQEKFPWAGAFHQHVTGA